MEKLLNDITQNRDALTNIKDKHKFCRELQEYINQKLIPADEDEYHVVSTLPSGNNNIFLSFHTSLGLVVVKEHVHLNGDWDMMLSTLYEISSLLKIFEFDSPYLARLYSIEITACFTRVVTQFLPVTFSLLFSRCQSLSLIEEKARELLMAVKALHKIGIAHRDIKANNIAFTQTGKLVLFDYDSTCSTSPRTTRPICTLNTRSPELLTTKDTSYDAQKLDMWSTGCVIVEMILTKPLIEVFEESINEEVLSSIKSFISSLHVEPEPTDNRVRTLKRRASPLLMRTIKCLMRLDPIEREWPSDEA